MEIILIFVLLVAHLDKVVSVASCNVGRIYKLPFTGDYIGTSLASNCPANAGYCVTYSGNYQATVFDAVNSTGNFEVGVCSSTNACGSLSCGDAVATPEISQIQSDVESTAGFTNFVQQTCNISCCQTDYCNTLGPDFICKSGLSYVVDGTSLVSNALTDIPCAQGCDSNATCVRVYVTGTLKYMNRVVAPIRIVKSTCGNSTASCNLGMPGCLNLISTAEMNSITSINGVSDLQLTTCSATCCGANSCNNMVFDAPMPQDLWC